MATEITFGNANAGAQAGVVNGDFRPEIHHYAPPERVETPPNPSIFIPFGRDADFVDRETTAESGTILDHVDQKCSRPGSRTALVGLGGVGKSQLAIEYAYRIRERSPETWVFWVHASNATRFEQSVRDIADCAKIFGRQDPKVNIFQLVHDWLSNKAKGPWVVILDNVDGAGVLTSSSAGREAETAGAIKAETGSSRPLLSYIPHCQHGSVLITSRSRSAALEIVEDGDIIAIEPMNVEDAATLFRRKLSRPEAEDTDEHVTMLVELLECMPLAIVQAVAYISQRWPRCSVQQYLDDYQASDRKKTGLLSYEAGQLRRDASAKNSILITWQISFDHIRQARPSAADILSLMSFCDRQGIPEMLLRGHDPMNQQVSHQARIDTTEEVEDEDDAVEWSDDSSAEVQWSKSEIDRFEDDVLVLRNYSFIHANEDGGSFEMHRLVQLATQEWLELSGEQQHWRHRFLSRLCGEMPMGEYENWATCRVLLPHARWTAAKMPKKRDSVAEWATVMYRAAWYCLETGNRTEAERLSVLAMKARKRIFEADDEELLWAMNMVASTYKLNGRWEDAEKLFVQVMQRTKATLGDDHPLTLNSMANLAATYRNQGRWEEAETLELQVMERGKGKLGEDHPSMLSSMANLAATYRYQGRWEEAEKLFMQVIERRKVKLGEDHPSMLSGMANLASTYRYQGRWEEAETLELQVMERRKGKLGEDHPSTLNSMANLASIYRYQGRWEEAEKLFMQVIERRKVKLGEDHPSALNSMANLASTYRNQGRWEEAEKLFMQVIERRKAKLGEDHPSTLSSMANLALTYGNQGRWEEAEKLEVKVIERRKAKLGKDHPAILSSMANLASTYRNQGRREEAETLELQVMERRKGKLGEDHPETLTSMANLACTYWSQGRTAESVDLMRRCVEAQKVKLGAEHPAYQNNDMILSQWVSGLDIAETGGVRSFD